MSYSQYLPRSSYRTNASIATNNRTVSISNATTNATNTIRPPGSLTTVHGMFVSWLRRISLNFRLPSRSGALSAYTIPENPLLPFLAASTLALGLVYTVVFFQKCQKQGSNLWARH